MEITHIPSHEFLIRLYKRDTQIRMLSPIIDQIYQVILYQFENKIVSSVSNGYDEGFITIRQDVVLKQLWKHGDPHSYELFNFVIHTYWKQLSEKFQNDIGKLPYIYATILKEYFIGCNYDLKIKE